MNSSRIIPPAWCFSEDKLMTSPGAFLEPSITLLTLMRWATMQREQSRGWILKEFSKNIRACQRCLVVHNCWETFLFTGREAKILCCKVNLLQLAAVVTLASSTLVVSLLTEVFYTTITEENCLYIFSRIKAVPTNYLNYWQFKTA